MNNREFKSWEHFKQVVKDAREHSVEWRKKHPELWNPCCIHVRVGIKEWKDEVIFDLNVWRINLITGDYGKETDLSDGIHKEVPNLKQWFKKEGQKNV